MQKKLLIRSKIQKTFPKNPYLFDLIDKIKKESKKKDISKKVILYCSDKIENMPTVIITS